jgi:hypothetical protein
MVCRAGVYERGVRLQYAGFQLGVVTTHRIKLPKEVTGSEKVGSTC